MIMVHIHLRFQARQIVFQWYLLKQVKWNYPVHKTRQGQILCQLAHINHYHLVVYHQLAHMLHHHLLVFHWKVHHKVQNLLAQAVIPHPSASSLLACHLMNPQDQAANQQQARTIFPCQLSLLKASHQQVP